MSSRSGAESFTRGGAARHRVVPHGAPAVAALREVIDAVRDGDLLRPVLVIVPDAPTGIAVRRTLAGRQASDAPGGAAGIAAIDVLTLSDLADRLAGPSLAVATRRPLPAGLVREAVALALRREAGAFAAVAEHPATVDALAGTVLSLRRLDGDGLTALEREARTARRPGLLPEILRIADEVRRHLTPDWYDAADLLDAAADVITAGRGRLGVSDIVLHLPRVPDAHETHLLRALGSTARLRVIAGATGSERADRPLLEALSELGLRVPAAEPPAPAHAHEVVHASDPDEEVRGVVRDVTAALADRPGRRIAVLHTRAEPYARILHEQFAAAGIAIDSPGCRSASERAAGRLLLGALRLHQLGFPRRETFDVLAGTPLLDADGGRAPVATWERISRDAGIVHGEDWDVRLARHLEVLKGREGEGSARDAGRTRALHRTVALLRESTRRAATARSWEESAAQLRSLVETLVDAEHLGPQHDADARAELRALEAVLAAIDALPVLDALRGAPDGASLVAALGADLDRRSPRIGRLGEGVLVGPLETATGLEFDVVHVVGASEDLLPGRLTEDALLPEEVRASTGGALPSIRDRSAAAERAFLAALQLAPRVSVSFSRGDLRARGSRIPSRWLLPSIRALAGQGDLADSDYLDAPGLLHRRSQAGELAAAAPERLATAQEWRLRALLAGERISDPVLEQARRAERARRSSEPTPHDGVIGPLPGLSPFETGNPVSATALETYATCPHAYFLRHVLGVREIEDPEEVESISARDRGTFIHECLDALITRLDAEGDLPGIGAPWSSAHRARLHGIADEVAAAYVARGLTGPARVWERSLADIHRDLDETLTQDSAWREAEQLEVLGSEVRFGFPEEDDAPALEIPVAGGVLRLKGSADKVDRAADGSLVVTDLKTGSSKRFQGIGAEDPVLGGTALQLPAYARAVRERLGDARTPAVRARYWFMKDGKSVDVPLTDAVDATYRETLGILARGIAGGVFPSHPPEGKDYGYVQCVACNPDGGGYARERERWREIRRSPAVRELADLIDPDPADVVDASTGADPRVGASREGGAR